MRLDANVSVAELSRATGVTAGHLWRIEAGQANPSMEVLIAVGVALGADLGVRYFPGPGPRIHDRFQAPMVEALIRSLDPRWRVQLEVPVTKPARGVIDAVLHDTTSPLFVASEVHSDLHRLEQQLRWGHEKAEGVATLQAAFPARSADAIAALTTPEARWPGPAVVWIHLHGTRASLMHFPPRGVSFGR